MSTKFNIEFDIVLRPIDNEWVMGEDVTIKVSRDSKFRDICDLIERTRSIPACRQQFKLLRTNKYIPKVNEDLSIRKYGLISGDILIVEPTMSNTWLWNPLEYYVDILTTKIYDVLDQCNGYMKISELEQIVKCPPAIKTSMQVFLRSYPERFYIYTDITSNIKWVHKSQYELQIPTFNSIPYTLGKVEKLKIPDFDFDAYADIDDTRPISIDFDIPKSSYNLCINSANDIMCPQESIYPNPICVIYFNETYVGTTSAEVKTLNPVWLDALFTLLIPPNENIFTSVLRIEVCDSFIDNDGEFQVKSCLGVLELREYKLTELLCGILNSSFTHELSKPPVDLNHESNYFGTITLCGGKSGFEIKVVSAYNISVSDERSKVFSILKWNGEEIGKTATTNSRVNPIWNQTWVLPTEYINQVNEDFKRRMSECTFEAQVWSTNPEYPDLKEDYFGSVMLKNDYLLNSLLNNYPYANFVTTPLQKSNIVTVKKKVPIHGNFTYIIGASGLHLNNQDSYELSLIDATGLTRFNNIFYIIQWNNQQIYKSDDIQLSTNEEYASADCNHKCLLNVYDASNVGNNNIADNAARGNNVDKTDDESFDAKFSNYCLNIEFFEALNSKRIGDSSDFGEYVGQVLIQGNELKSLLLSKYASVQTFSLERNPKIDIKRQNLVRGKLKLRGGIRGLRAVLERILVVYSCIDLPSNISDYNIKNSSHLPSRGFGFLDRNSKTPKVMTSKSKHQNKFLNIETNNFVQKKGLYVVVSMNGSEVGRTEIVNNSKFPMWDSNNVFYVNLSHNEKPILKSITSYPNLLKAFAVNKPNVVLEQDSDKLSTSDAYYENEQFHPNYDNISLEFEVFHTNLDVAPESPKNQVHDANVNDMSHDISLGYVHLAGDALVQLLESREAFENVYNLISRSKSKKYAGFAPQIKLGNIGNKYSSIHAYKNELRRILYDDVAAKKQIHNQSKNNNNLSNDNNAESNFITSMDGNTKYEETQKTSQQVPSSSTPLDGTKTKSISALTVGKKNKKANRNFSKDKSNGKYVEPVSDDDDNDNDEDSLSLDSISEDSSDKD